MPLVKSIFIKGTTDFGRAKAELDDVAARARKVGEMSPTIGLKVDDGAALLKLKAFSMELRALKDSGSQSGLSDLAGRLKSFGNEAGTSRTKMAALKLETDALKASMGGSGGGGRGGLAGAAAGSESAFAGMSGPAGMGAAIAAGVTLAPIITTLGVGFAGLAAGAYGVIAPIEKAASKTGGLKANLGKLDTEQQIAARSILGLGKQYSVFEKSLQPEVLGALNAGIRIAGHLMHDVQPVAAATGRAFDGFLGQVDREFQSGQFRQFFQFMGTTAAPDMRLLGTTVIDLTKDLPPLLEALQPVGHGLLVVADDALKAAGAYTHLIKAGEDALLKGNRPGSFGTQIHDYWKYGWAGAPKAAADTAALGGAMAKTGDQSRLFGTHLATVAADVTAVMTAEQKSLSTLTAYAGDLVTTANDAASLKAALKASHDEIGLHTAAQRNSFTAANTFITDLANQATAAYASGRGVGASIKAIRDGLPILENAKTKNRAYWEEVKTLVAWLDKLRSEKNIRELVIVTGTGSWTMHNPKNQSLPGGYPGGRAAGWRVPGFGGGDRWPAMLEGGEAVIDKHRTAMLAPLFRSLGVPGFAAGGIAGSYGGALAGLGPWAARDNRATVSAVGGDIARAIAAGVVTAVRSATAGAGGSGAAALFRRMYPAWGGGAMWAATNYVAMKESGWNTTAVNPTSGAAGVAQRIQGWAPFYQPGNAFQQDKWFHDYMLTRYGGPVGAAIHESSQGWYDHGGWLPPGLSLALNTTGRPERVGGGSTYHITVHVPPLGRPADVGREVVSAIRAFEKGSGNSWRK